MSQVTDFDVPTSPLTMSALAVALEAVFAALGSINRGATAPSNPFEGMLWWDSTAVAEILKRYTVTFGWVSILSVNRTTGAFDLIPATDAATVSTVMKRDSGGRAKVVAPAVAADIALKSTVTADIATHDALATAHGVSSATYSLAGSGDFTAGTVYAIKQRNWVTVSWTGVTHASDSTPGSDTVLASAYRPAVDKYITVWNGSLGQLETVWIATTGQFFIYHTSTIAYVDKTTARDGSVTFYKA